MICNIIINIAFIKQIPIIGFTGSCFSSVFLFSFCLQDMLVGLRMFLFDTVDCPSRENSVEIAIRSET